MASRMLMMLLSLVKRKKGDGAKDDGILKATLQAG